MYLIRDRRNNSKVKVREYSLFARGDVISNNNLRVRILKVFFAIILINVASFPLISRIRIKLQFDSAISLLRFFLNCFTDIPTIVTRNIVLLLRKYITGVVS